MEVSTWMARAAKNGSSLAKRDLGVRWIHLYVCPRSLLIFKLRKPGLGHGKVGCS